MVKLTQNDIKAFQRKMFRFYTIHGRNLPFRHTSDPYKITVSELMLQQTQVERVIPKYKSWIKKWPNWRSLAKASNRDLLRMWSGLGYNRRALYLGEMAREIMKKHGGKTPDTIDLLLTLPGIGPYTAHAILIFSQNHPIVTIDTNIRRVLIHEFQLPPSISKTELEMVAEQLLPKHRSRDWHNALMDYSRIVLSRKMVSIPSGSKQSRFDGSIRQIRGEIVRQLTTKRKVTIASIMKSLDRSEENVIQAAESLQKDGIIILSGKTMKLM
jgi:A/G-specific adenine glycosylase